MIIDALDNLEKYASLNPLFPKAMAYLKSTDLLAHEAGKVELEGKDLFVNFAPTKGKSKEDAVIETHVKMIDIQIPLDATEVMGYTPLCDLPEAAYNEEKDITKYPGVVAQDYVTIKPGMFAIFFPQDGHAPCITDVKEIKKVIVKVKA